MNCSAHSLLVHARYLVAADGAHSSVRAAVGISMHGSDHLVEGLTALFRGIADLQPRIERIGAVSSGAQLAQRFRQDSTFRIGDAAHRLTPRGGTRMNTAIHDGYDLGWKLT
ncbi:MAG: FAD-dependent monooxygenase [Pseudonocardiales bacterium]|nr:FAD-dependent monooxygenase [Pseudonocardiales bacterium]